jgi:bifunctional non-homologous end joining protein LigD
VSTATTVEVGGRTLRVTNLDKVLWPATGWTKREMLRFDEAIAPVLVPHIAGRPLTLARFPDGVDGIAWYQTNCRGHPSWLTTHVMTGKRGATFRMCVVDDAASLLWVANLGTIELHPFLATGARPTAPLAVVFDLDPGPPADLVDCARVALRVRARLHAVALESFPKTSGAAGLHVVVPLDGSDGFPATKAFARTLAEELAADAPHEVVSRSSRALRRGRVLIDWLQNDPTRSTIAPYSLRATPSPRVSTPLSWEEVEQLAAGHDPDAIDQSPAAVLDRVERLGDLHAPVLRLRQRLGSL